jgi:hypothetical protein
MTVVYEHTCGIVWLITSVITTELSQVVHLVNNKGSTMQNVITNSTVIILMKPLRLQHKSPCVICSHLYCLTFQRQDTKYYTSFSTVCWKPHLAYCRLILNRPVPCSMAVVLTFASFRIKPRALRAIELFL